MHKRLIGCLVLFLVAGAALAASSSQVERALRSQQRLAERRPASPGIQNDLGNLLLLSGDTQAAEAAYRRALELDATHAAARLNLALLLQQTDRQKAALRELGRLLDQEPEHAWAHYHRGVLLADRGQRSRALRHYARALQLEPRLAEPEVNPHFVRNELRTSALLMASAATSPATMAPRSYHNPKRVARLLVPQGDMKPRERAPKTPAEPPAPAEPSAAEGAGPPDAKGEG